MPVYQPDQPRTTVKSMPFLAVSSSCGVCTLCILYDASRGRIILMTDSFGGWITLMTDSYQCWPSPQSHCHILFSRPLSLRVTCHFLSLLFPQSFCHIQFSWPLSLQGPCQYYNPYYPSRTPAAICSLIPLQHFVIRPLPPQGPTTLCIM